MSKNLVKASHHQTFESLNKKKIEMNFGVLEN